MTLKIAILDTSTQQDGSFTVSGVFWLVAPNNRIVPIDDFKSLIPNISDADRHQLQQGILVEEYFNSGLLPSDTTLENVQTILQSKYDNSQSVLTNSNPTVSGLIGNVFDGVSWNNSDPTTVLWVANRAKLLNDYGIPKVQTDVREGNKTQVISQNFCDKHTWYSTSTRHIAQSMIDVGDGYTFKLSDDKVGVDVNHGRILHERRLRSTYQPIVKVNDVVKTEKDAHDNNGDYLIDYLTMRITFDLSQSGNTITIDYSEVINSRWYLKPAANKRLRLISAELQFSADARMDDTFIFQPRGDVAKFSALAPYYDANGGPYPAGTMLPLGDPTCYQTIFDLVTEANLAYPVVPRISHTDATWRDLVSDVVIFSWDYNGQATVDISDGPGNQPNDVEIRLEHDVEMAGSAAVVTFYCLSEDL